MGTSSEFSVGDRAVNEYNLAVRTKDNAQGAQEEAAKYLKSKYERKRSVESEG